jgi:hypothetical protein
MNIKMADQEYPPDLFDLPETQYSFSLPKRTREKEIQELKNIKLLVSTSPSFLPASTYQLNPDGTIGDQIKTAIMDPLDSDTDLSPSLTPIPLGPIGDIEEDAHDTLLEAQAAREEETIQKEDLLYAEAINDELLAKRAGYEHTFREDPGGCDNYRLRNGDEESQDELEDEEEITLEIMASKELWEEEESRLKRLSIKGRKINSLASFFEKKEADTKKKSGNGAR